MTRVEAGASHATVNERPSSSSTSAKNGIAMNRRQASLVLLLLLSVAGCGYVMAGQWEDDPKNWGRAFHSTKPPDVRVIHSRYWRSPHWSYEFQYFFDVAPNATLRAQLFREHKLRQLTGDEAERVRQDAFGDRPSWFAPKEANEYEVWVFEDAPGSNFKVLIDKSSLEMFLNDYSF